MKLISTVAALAAIILLPGAPAATPMPAPGAERPQAKAPKAKRGERCAVRKLDVKTGMVVTRYGCNKPPQGRWRDVAKSLGPAAPP